VRSEVLIAEGVRGRQRVVVACIRIRGHRPTEDGHATYADVQQADERDLAAGCVRARQGDGGRVRTGRHGRRLLDADARRLQRPGVVRHAQRCGNWREDGLDTRTCLPRSSRLGRSRQRLRDLQGTVARRSSVIVRISYPLHVKDVFVIRIHL